MKKIALIIFAVLLIAGCQQKTGAFFEVDKKIGNDNLIRSDEKFRLEFFVKNPLTSTVTGNITYNFNKRCFNDDIPQIGFSEPFEVQPLARQGVIRIFTPKLVGNSDPPTECLNKPQEFSIVLYDKSGLTKDSFQTRVTIIPR